MPGLYHGRRLRSRGLCGRRGRARRAAAARRHRGRRRRARPRLVRACTPTASRWCARWSSTAGLSWDAPAPFDARRDARRGDADADAHLREVRALPRSARPGRSRRWRTSPAAASPTTSRACCRRARRRASISRACRCCRCSRWLAKTGGIAEPEMLRTFNCGDRHDRGGRAAQGRRGQRGARARGRDRCCGSAR